MRTVAQYHEICCKTGLDEFLQKHLSFTSSIEMSGGIEDALRTIASSIHLMVVRVPSPFSASITWA